MDSAFSNMVQTISDFEYVYIHTSIKASLNFCAQVITVLLHCVKVIPEDFLHWGLTKKKHFKVQRAGWARIFPWGRKIAVVDFKSRYTGMHSLL